MAKKKGGSKRPLGRAPKPRTEDSLKFLSPADKKSDLFKASNKLTRDMRRVRAQMKNEASQDAASKKLMLSMLNSVTRLLPIAERKFVETKSEGAGYCYSALMNQAKDLTAQIRSLASHDMQARFIGDNIIGATMVLAVQMLMTSMAPVKSAIDGLKLDPTEAKAMRRRVDDALRDYVGWAQQAQESMADRVHEYLCGGDAPASGGKSKAPKAKRAGPRSREHGGEAMLH